MKYLVSVLLVTTLTIASSVAAGKTPQGGVMASAPEVPSMEPKTNKALCDNDCDDDEIDNCPKPAPVFVTIPIPECEDNCKRKCQFCETKCEKACDAGKEKCSDKCSSIKENCRGKCTPVQTCKAKCTCTPCPPSAACLELCIAAVPDHPGRCNGACNQIGKVRCVEICENILKPPPAPSGLCASMCALPEPTPCTDSCNCVDACNVACEDCSRTCLDACDTAEDACEHVCDSGAGACKDYCKLGTEDCEKTCKPCEATCEKACEFDQEECLSDCKLYLGSNQQCWDRCNRDCELLCKHSCKCCHSPAADATVSEQLQPKL